MTGKPINFHHAIPILWVRDLDASVRYYTERLGFTIDWSGSGMSSVSRGDASVMLCRGAQGNPGTWVWIGVGSAEALYDELTASGADVKLPPTNYPWALEIHVVDPDGHVLRFGSDTADDRPVVDWVAWY